MKFSSDKDINLFVEQLVREGWSFKRGKKHGKLMIPGCGEMIVVPSTPSKARALKEMKSLVRRMENYALPQAPRGQDSHE